MVSNIKAIARTIQRLISIDQQVNNIDRIVCNRAYKISFNFIHASFIA